MGKVFKFNPGFQSDDEAVANFIVRRRELDAVIAALEAGGSGPPRVLVVAPRGAGKTTLCRRVLAEIRRSEALGLRWHAVFLGEESYTVTTPGEFFLECLFQLRDQSPGAELEAAYEKAAAATGEDELVVATLSALREFARKTQRRLLIIVENFHIILHDQIGEGADTLLALLADENLFGVLATSVAQALAEEEGQLPQDYKRLTLRPLSLEECHSLWESLTDQSVKAERIRPLQILTGGSPRLLHILADFMRTPSLRDLMANLNLLIDQNTEYFKSQLDALPAIERKVFAALLDAWDPRTSKQIAESARVNTNVASAMLSRLNDRGAVIKEHGQGRAAFYYASERLFNIYYLMRRRSHPSSRVRALVSFMTEYYDRDELIDTTARLVREACAIEPEARTDYHSTFDAIMARAPEADRRRILELTPREFIHSFRQDQRAQRQQLAYLAEQEVPPSQLGEDDVHSLIDRIEAAADEGDFDSARELVQEFIARKPSSPEPWLRLSLLHHAQRDYTAATEAARQSLSLRPDDPWGYAVLGAALERDGQRTEAIDAFLAALKLDPANVMALDELADIREEEGDLEGAIELFEAARADGGFSSDTLWAHYGYLLHEAGQVEKAEAVLREGIGESAYNVSTRRALVSLLDETDRQDEAIAILRLAAEQSDKWEPWADLGAFLQVRTDSQVDAIHALEMAIEKGGLRIGLYRCLADAKLEAGLSREEVQNVIAAALERFEGSADAWLLAGDIYRSLHEDEQAEKAFRTAIDEGNGDVGRVLLARLLATKAERRDEAESLLRDALSNATGREACGPSKELAELLIHKGDDSEADAVIEAALAANARCGCCLVLHGQICARRGDKEAAEERFGAALDLQGGDIAALTGLARVVDPAKARVLLERAMEIAPNDPRCLVTRAQLKIGDIESQISDAKAALERDPDYLEAHLLLAPLNAARGESEIALEHLEHALELIKGEREFIPTFVSAAMSVASYGHGPRVSHLLEASEASDAIEPLLIALQLARGEQPRVAKEALEVAKDIVDRHGSQAS